MLMDEEETDVIAELERMDRFFDGEEAGDIPLEFLRQRGLDIPALPPDDDAELRAKLQELIEEMFEIGIIVDCRSPQRPRPLSVPCRRRAARGDDVVDVCGRSLAYQRGRWREQGGQRELSSLLRG
jgi:hypothetical protein